MKKSIFAFVVLVAIVLGTSCSNNPTIDNPRNIVSGITQIDSLCRLGEDLIYSYKYNEADRILEELLVQSVRLNNSYGKLKYNFFKGLKASKEGDIKSAIRYLNFCVENSRTENLYIYTDAMITLGDIYSSINNSYLAHGYYLEGLDLAISSNNNLIIRHVYSRIGLVLFRQKQFAQSREYFVKALEIYKHTSANFNDFFKIQELTNNIGLTYFEQRDYTMAMQQFREGLKEIYRLGEDSSILVPFLNKAGADALKKSWTSAAEGVILGNIGRIFLKTNQLDSAEKYLQRNVELNLDKIEPYDATLSLLYLMEVYLKRKDYQAFSKISSIAQNTISKHNFSALKARQKLLLSDFYYKTGEYKSAYEKQSQFKLLNDSLNELSKEILFTDVPTVYLLLKRSNSLELLEKQAELKSWQNRILLSLVILIFLTLVFIALYLRKERKIRARFQLLNTQLEMEKSKLELANKELEALNKEKTMILGVVAHDLRNPINIIKGFSDLLAHEEQLSELNKQSVQYIHQSCDKALETINDLVEIARFGVDNELKLSPTNVIPLLEHTLDAFKKIADEKDIHLGLESFGKREIVAQINEAKFQRVIDNLVSNAIKFTHKGGSVKLDASLNDEFFVLKVSDNGVGIPEENIPKIFDRFTKAGRYGTAGEKSLGLGMSIVKTIVEMHGGKITVESEENKGTTFTVSIPL